MRAQHLALLIFMAASFIAPCISKAEAAEETPLRISEVLVLPRDEESRDQRIELTNVSDAPLDLWGYQIWIHGLVHALPGELRLAPGNRFVVHFGVEGVDDGNNLYVGSNRVSLRPGADVITLFRDGSLVDFVQWGRGGQAGERLAVALGLWEEGTFVAPPAAPGLSAQACRRGFGAGIWGLAFGTIGGPNVCGLPVATEVSTWGSLKLRHR